MQWAALPIRRVARSLVPLSTVSVSILLLWGFISPVKAANPDQSFTGTTTTAGWLISEGAAYVAQTVTAGVSGNLTDADVYLGRFPSMITPWEVTVRSVAAGVPTSNILATEVLPTSAALMATDPLGPMSVHFDTPVHFNAGDMFALTVRSPGAAQGAGDAVGIWDGSAIVDYPGGGVFGSNDGVLFVPSSGDAYFTTFMTPEPTVLGTVAILMAVGVRRHRA